VTRRYGSRSPGVHWRASRVAIGGRCELGLRNRRGQNFLCQAAKGRRYGSAYAMVGVGDGRRSFNMGRLPFFPLLIREFFFEGGNRNGGLRIHFHPGQRVEHVRGDQGRGRG